MRNRSMLLITLTALAFVGAGCFGGGSSAPVVPVNHAPVPTPVVPATNQAPKPVPAPTAAASCDGHFLGHSLVENNTSSYCGASGLDFTVANGKLTGNVLVRSGVTAPVAADVTSDCQIINGKTLGTTGRVVSFKGSLSGTTGGGTFSDTVGCSGTFNLTKQ